MIQLELHGKPISWRASQHKGKFHYDPKQKEKEQAKWQIRAQYRDKPIEGFVNLEFIFFFPIPKSTSRIKRRQMLAGIIPPSSCDTTNCQKFYEDCLKGIVISDDRYSKKITSDKRYSENPGVSIRVISLKETLPHDELLTGNFSS